jgi:hypothetical protein
MSRGLRLLAPLAVLLAACGGGGGGGGGGGVVVDTPPPGSVIDNPDSFGTIPFAAPRAPDNNAASAICPTIPAPGSGAAPAGADIAGRITFDRIPFFPASGGAGVGTGLDYASPRAEPARGILVEAVAASGGVCNGAVVASALTDGDGWYGLSVPANQAVCLRARAQLYRSGTPAWDMAVLDNTNSNRLYALTDGLIASSGERPRRDLHMASGHAGSAYSGARAAAPFAILDTACKVLNAVLAVEPQRQFPAMSFRWSVRNTSSEEGPIDEGFIGGAFFSGSQRAIYLRGDAAVDTDEFDETVIAHELAHYFTHAFGRSDTVGGDHSVLDNLDAAVAFDEGWATAFAGLALGTSLYRDSDEVATVNAPSKEFRFSIESPQQNFFESTRTPGWFNEATVHHVLYDIGDGAADSDGDGVTLVFADLWRIVTGTAQRDTPALATLFSFVSALKAARPDQAAAVDALLDAEGVDGAVVDSFASAESNAPAAADLPLYRSIGVLGQGGTVQRVCSRNAYGNLNRLSNQRYLRFDSGGGRYRFRATRVDAAGVPGLALLRQGGLVSCSGGLSRREAASGTASVSFDCDLPATTLVLAAYHVPYLRTEETPQGPDRCFDITVEVAP